MSKPDWKDAPEWAMWLAQDADGLYCWFFNKPYEGEACWMPDISGGFNPHGDTYDTVHGDFAKNPRWKKSLESRP